MAIERPKPSFIDTDVLGEEYPYKIPKRIFDQVLIVLTFTYMVVPPGAKYISGTESGTNDMLSAGGKPPSYESQNTLLELSEE